MTETTKPTSTQVLDIHVDAIVPNSDNVNEISEDDLKKLCEHISEVGFVAPIQVVPMSEDQYIILGGEHRWRAAKAVGMTYVPAVVLTDAKWTDSDLFDLSAFKLNNIHGSQNPEKFMRLYERLAQKFGADSLKEVFAVTDKFLWKKLTKSIKQDLKKSGLPGEVIDQIDGADKKSKDFNQFTKKLNKIFSAHAAQSENGCILFTSGKSEQMVVKANEIVFSSMKALSQYASSQGKNVNEYLEPMLVELLKKLEAMGASSSVSPPPSAATPSATLQ